MKLLLFMVLILAYYNSSEMSQKPVCLAPKPVKIKTKVS